MSVTTEGKEESSVTVNVTNGETLTYRMTVRGPNPHFTLEAQEAGITLLSHESAPVSEEPLVFERQWPSADDDLLSPEHHTLGMNFAGFTEYHYEVIRRRPGAADATVMDATYSGTDDEHFHDLTVVLN